MELLARLANQAGADADLCARVPDGDTARWVAELAHEAGLARRFHQVLAQAAAQALAAELAPGARVKVLAFAPEGESLARAEATHA